MNDSATFSRTPLDRRGVQDKIFTWCCKTLTLFAQIFLNIMVLEHEDLKNQVGVGALTVTGIRAIVALNL